MPTLPLVLASAEIHVEAWVTALFGALLVGLIVCLALEEKIHAKKSVIAGSFALVGLFLAQALQLIPGVVGVHAGDVDFVLPIYITSINWEVISTCCFLAISKDEL